MASLSCGELRPEAHEGDRGFTLIELVVSLTILAIGIVGVIGVMNSSFGVAVRTNERSRAVALATREIESLRAVDWLTLIPASSSTSRNESVGGTNYTIETALTWVADGSNPYATKKATVDVRWTDAGATVHDVAQTTMVYPGGYGPVAPSSSSSCGSGGTPAAPVALVAGAPGILTENSVDLAWTPPASSSTAIATWRIDMTSNGTTQTLTTSHPASSLFYRVEGLSANTSYTFKVAGLSACGNLSAWSPVSTITTLASGLTTCTLGTPNVTPSAVKLQNAGNNSGLAATVTMSVNTTGNCAGLYVQYRAVSSTNRTQLFSGSSVKTLTLTSSGPWDIGVHTLNLYDAANVKRGSLLLTVCAHNSSTCG